MTTTVEAIYEQGVLRLLQPLSLTEGTRVAVIVIPQEPPAAGRTPVDMLATIAALPWPPKRSYGKSGLEPVSQDRLGRAACGVQVARSHGAVVPRLRISNARGIIPGGNEGRRHPLQSE